MWSSPGKHLVLTVKSGLSRPKICGGVQVNEILTPLTFSDISRPEEYSRHESKHTHTNLINSDMCGIDAHVNEGI